MVNAKRSRNTLLVSELKVKPTVRIKLANVLKEYSTSEEYSIYRAEVNSRSGK